MTVPFPITGAERALIHRQADDLHQAFSGVFGVETIEALLLSSFDDLFARSTTHNQFRLVLVERFARDRLQALARAQGYSGRDVPAVLFVCTHNAGRSQMAFGWFSHLAEGRAMAWSGGSDPVTSINPVAVAAMSEVGIDISTGYSKPWTEETLLGADAVVTMGCGDACPLFPGKHYEDWEVQDPAGRSLEEVRAVRDDIGHRVVDLLNRLGVTPVATTWQAQPPGAQPPVADATTTVAQRGIRLRWRHPTRPAARG